MNGGQLLKGKHAVIFGAGGSFGSVVAREFAAEGAEVFLSGRSRLSVEEIAKRILGDGGTARAAAIDAADPAAVDAYVDAIATETGSIDVVFNLIGPRLTEYGGGKSATQLSVDEFMAPLVTLVKSQFITSRAAARHAGATLGRHPVRDWQSGPSAHSRSNGYRCSIWRHRKFDRKSCAGCESLRRPSGVRAHSCHA
jgi:NAD(P)-dependent dehydrogenase (short-subunit alcohol dehydrogenase family)